MSVITLREIIDVISWEVRNFYWRVRDFENSVLDYDLSKFFGIITGFTFIIAFFFILEKIKEMRNK